MKNANENVMSAIANRIETLEEMLTHENTNKKAIVKQLIQAFETLEKYTSNEEYKEIYKNIIDECKRINDNNENMRYNAMIFYAMINEKFNNEMNLQYLSYENDDEKKTEAYILTTYEMTAKENKKMTSDLFSLYKELIGKEEVFVQYLGELDNISFMDFEEYASSHALCVKMIQTEDGRPIYYYGGRNYEKVLKTIDYIDEYTSENGLQFDMVSYKSSKQMKKKI